MFCFATSNQTEVVLHAPSDSPFPTSQSGVLMKVILILLPSTRTFHFSPLSFLFQTSTADSRHTERVCHVNGLRDIRPAPHDPSMVVLACSDNTAKVVSVNSNTIVVGLACVFFVRLFSL